LQLESAEGIEHVSGFEKGALDGTRLRKRHEIRQQGNVRVRKVIYDQSVLEGRESDFVAAFTISVGLNGQCQDSKSENAQHGTGSDESLKYELDEMLW
jgi:hypothetical protein